MPILKTQYLLYEFTVGMLPISIVQIRTILREYPLWETHASGPRRRILKCSMPDVSANSRYISRNNGQQVSRNLGFGTRRLYHHLDCQGTNNELRCPWTLRAAAAASIRFEPVDIIDGGLSARTTPLYKDGGHNNEDHISEMELQSTTAVPDPSSKYVLTSAKNEKQRLSDQHELVVKTIYGGRLIYDQSVKIAATDCVLDSGTGTGSWITDLSKEVPDTTQLVGIDIFVGLVPSTPPSNIQFLEASATKLPEDWTARYNFVHQRLLFGALTATEWKIALNEMFRVLKPGGSIQLAEIASPDWANGGDEERLMQAAASALWKDRGLLLECGKIIPDILKDAGFVDIRSEFRPLPLGQGAGHLGKLGSASIIGAYRGMKKPIAEAKGYGLIESGEQWDEILQNVEKGWDENPGRTVTFVVICAKKSDA